MSKAQVEACTQVQRPWGRNALGELEAQKEAGGPGAGGFWVSGRGAWVRGWGCWRSGQGCSCRPQAWEYEDLCWTPGKSLEAVWLQKTEPITSLREEAC